MSTNLVNKIKKIAVFSFIIVIIAAGCKKKEDSNSTTTEDPASPTMPAVNTFAMDFSDFSSGKSIKVDSISRKNYNAAAFTVGVWNLFIAAGLYVPVTAFKVAIQQKAQYQGNNKWLFSFSFNTANNDAYTAKLTAEKITGGVNWEMKVSRANYYTDYLWYSGYSKDGLTEGTWRLYFDTVKTNVSSGKLQNSIPLVDILWHNTSGKYDIKYTNAVPGGKENGGYITYGTNSNTPFNAYYYIYNKGLNNLTKIEWNRTDKSGHGYDKNFYKDTLWHCWDTYKNDQICK